MKAVSSRQPAGRGKQLLRKSEGGGQKLNQKNNESYKPGVAAANAISPSAKII